MTDLAIPFTQSQVDAANRLHRLLTQWVLTDNSLVALAKIFPDFGPEASLLKTAAINQLYGTNLYAVVRMVEHISNVIVNADVAQEGPSLIERLAT